MNNDETARKLFRELEKLEKQRAENAKKGDTTENEYLAGKMAGVRQALRLLGFDV